VIDIEINKALAMAIGWTAERMMIGSSGLWLDRGIGHGGDKFDYRDPAVIWPIAERYNAFPRKTPSGWGVLPAANRIWEGWDYHDTAAKAVAYVVIGCATGEG